MIGKLKILFTCIAIGVAVALTYYFFEYAFRQGINLIWQDLFNTTNTRWLVVPICLVLALVFFGMQHYLDPNSETHESHGLGEDQANPNFKKFFKILLIGFFSLVAGASLGPEAVLVPASLVAGAIIGSKLLKKENQASQIVSAAAIIALFTAFFHSFIIGMLTIFLVTKVAKAKVTPALIVLGIFASGSAFLVLNIIEPKSNSYFNFPDSSWEVKVVDALIALALVIFGFGSTFALKGIHTLFEKVRFQANKIVWWQHALVAGLVLSIIYLIGGPYIQFTGNEAIKPLLSDAKNLGVLGLLFIIIAKLIAISWSKAIGYRGGLIFPMIFVASGFATISHLIYPESNYMFALIATLAGILLAEKKAKILL